MKIEKTIIMSIKNLIMSIGILSLTILILYTLYISNNNIVVSNILFFISSLKLWLQPPYLYFIMNFIILAVVVSSRFHYNHHDHHQYHQHDVIPVRDDQYDVVSHLAETVIVEGIRREWNDVVFMKDVEVVENSSNVKDDDQEEVNLMKKINDESTVIEEPTWTSRIRSQPLIIYQGFEKLSPEYSSEIPPASSRFDRRDHVEGGKALKVSKPKHDTLENTWKAINEGRNMPYSTTTEQGRSQKIKVKGNITSTKLSKEPSLSQDELNRQVEAFISKFKEQMRLQRQQSMQQFIEMIDNATY